MVRHVKTSSFVTTTVNFYYLFVVAEGQSIAVRTARLSTAISKLLKETIIEFNAIPNVEDHLPEAISYSEAIKADAPMWHGQVSNVPESIKVQIKDIQNRMARATEEISLVKSDIQSTISSIQKKLDALAQRCTTEAVSQAEHGLKACMISIGVDYEETLRMFAKDCAEYVDTMPVPSYFKDLIDTSTEAAASRTWKVRAESDTEEESEEEYVDGRESSEEDIVDSDSEGEDVLESDSEDDYD